MCLGGTVNVELSTSDLMTIRAGLRAYLHAFDEHRQGDGGATHGDAEWADLRRQVGTLIWRLEEAGVAPGTTVTHSAEAVEPSVEDPATS